MTQLIYLMSHINMLTYYSIHTMTNSYTHQIILDQLGVRRYHDRNPITLGYRTRIFNVLFGILKFGTPQFGSPGVYLGILKVVFGIQSFRIWSFGNLSFGISRVYQAS